MKKDLIKLILIFFISIFVIGLLPIVQFIWAFMPTKLVTKEEKQHIEYVVNTAFEDDLGLKVKKIEIPTLVLTIFFNPSPLFPESYRGSEQPVRSPEVLQLLASVLPVS